MKRELAGTVGQLSCLQSDTSHLSTSPCTSELLSQTLCLASEHVGATFDSLRASFVKPYLTLLTSQSPSSVKQGILIRYHPICGSKAAFPIQEWFISHFVHCVVCYALAFLDALPHLCLHVNLVSGDSDSRAALSALIGLMEDSDPAVRKSFSQSVRFLLVETERNPEQCFLREVSHSD